MLDPMAQKHLRRRDPHAGIPRLQKDDKIAESSDDRGEQEEEQLVRVDEGVQGLEEERFVERAGKFEAVQCSIRQKLNKIIPCKEKTL